MKNQELLQEYGSERCFSSSEIPSTDRRRKFSGKLILTIIQAVLKNRRVGVFSPGPGGMMRGTYQIANSVYSQVIRPSGRVSTQNAKPNVRCKAPAFSPVRRSGL